MTRNHVNVYADGFGRWHAEVRFPTTLSESDPRPEYNLGHQWESIRRVARNAIVREITDREQKTWETRNEAARRIRRTLPRLVVIDQDLDAMNRWHGVTLGEPSTEDTQAMHTTTGAPGGLGK